MIKLMMVTDDGIMIQLCALGLFLLATFFAFLKPEFFFTSNSKQSQEGVRC